MFEQIHIPALFMANQATLSLCASGRTSGVVIDAGYDVTRIVPIYEMCSLPYATRCLDFGGNHLTQYLKKILMEKGCNPKSIGWLNLGRKKITAGIETLIDSFTKRLMHACGCLARLWHTIHNTKLAFLKCCPLHFAPGSP